jgi:hypothetical protein
MNPLAAVLDAILVVNFDVVSIKKDDTNDQQNDHQNLEAVNPIAISHCLKPPDNRRVQQPHFRDVAESSR